eukprot:649973-Hanusia_phi.AAC.5
MAALSHWASTVTRGRAPGPVPRVASSTVGRAPGGPARPGRGATGPLAVRGGHRPVIRAAAVSLRLAGRARHSDSGLRDCELGNPPGQACLAYGRGHRQKSLCNGVPTPTHLMVGSDGVATVQLSCVGHIRGWVVVYI